MPAATNDQMQAYCDQRLRPFAELARKLYTLAADDKAAIDDAYARAVGPTAWADARADGPPHLLQSGAAATPDDLLNFNSFVTAFKAIIDGAAVAADAANAAAMRAAWPVLMRACVRPAV